MFRRKVYGTLLEWKKESGGQTAAMIEGARRIGKSTIAEEFAKNEYESYILIDFSIASKAIRDLFEDISDLNYLFLQLQLIQTQLRSGFSNCTEKQGLSVGNKIFGIQETRFS